MIYIGIIGYGTVGSGVYEVIQTNKENIARRAGEEIEVKKICDLRQFPGDPAEALLTCSTIRPVEEISHQLPSKSRME